MNTDEFAINWQNFARVRLHLKFAFIIRLIEYNKLHIGKLSVYAIRYVSFLLLMPS